MGTQRVALGLPKVDVRQAGLGSGGVISRPPEDWTPQPVNKQDGHLRDNWRIHVRTVQETVLGLVLGAVPACLSLNATCKLLPLFQCLLVKWMPCAQPPSV